MEMKRGGLGIRRLDMLDKDLIGKWNWRFAIEGEALWTGVIGCVV